MKLKSVEDLRRFALERGASVELDGEAFNVGKERVERPAQLARPVAEKPAVPAPTAPPPPAPVEQPSPLPIIQAIAQQNARLVGEVTRILATSGAPVEWRFRVVRDKKNLIDEIIATPVRH